MITQRKSPPSTVYYADGKSNFDLWLERKIAKGVFKKAFK